jgi:hypothetical protein
MFISIFYFFQSKFHRLPVIYMVRDVTILMRENPFRWPLEGGALKIETFLGSSAIWAQKSRDFSASKSLSPSAI